MIHVICLQFQSDLENLLKMVMFLAKPMCVLFVGVFYFSRSTTEIYKKNKLIVIYSLLNSITFKTVTHVDVSC